MTGKNTVRYEDRMIIARQEAGFEFTKSWGILTVGGHTRVSREGTAAGVDPRQVTSPDSNVQFTQQNSFQPGQPNDRSRRNNSEFSDEYESSEEETDNESEKKLTPNPKIDARGTPEKGRTANPDIDGTGTP